MSWRPEDWENPWRKIAEDLGCIFPDKWLLPGNVISVTAEGEVVAEKAIAYEEGADKLFRSLIIDLQSRDPVCGQPKRICAHCFQRYLQ